MNRIYNTWTFIISIITLPFAFEAGLNQTYGAFGFQGGEFEYMHLIFGSAAVFIFLIGMFRASRKWLGIRVISKKDRFVFFSRPSIERKKRTLLLSTIEIIGLFILGITFTVFSRDAAYITLVFFALTFDLFINLIVGVGFKKYGIGLTSKAIVAVDREVTPIYFTGLKKVSLDTNKLFFEYINGLVLDLELDIIPPQRRREFLEQLRAQINQDKVYFTGFD